MKKFDMVYLWVNGQDEVWRQKRIENAKKYLDKDTWVFANVEGRFRDNDELLFSFRSLIPYLSKINKIYLITDNQTPAWFKNHRRNRDVSTPCFGWSCTPEKLWVISSIWE